MITAPAAPLRGQVVTTRSRVSAGRPSRSILVVQLSYILLGLGVGLYVAVAAWARLSNSFSPLGIELVGLVVLSVLVVGAASRIGRSPKRWGPIVPLGVVAALLLSFTPALALASLVRDGYVTWGPAELALAGLPILMAVLSSLVATRSARLPRT